MLSDRDLAIAVVVDTREQTPLEFPISIRGTMETGDYSVPGCEWWLAAEWKTTSDLWRCVGTDRDRFRRQCDRLGQMKAGCLVVEPTISEILRAPVVSKVSPDVVVNTLISWSSRLHLPVFWAGSRRNAQGVIRSWLRHSIRHHGDVDKAAATALAVYGQNQRLQHKEAHRESA